MSTIPPISPPNSPPDGVTPTDSSSTSASPSYASTLSSYATTAAFSLLTPIKWIFYLITSPFKFLFSFFTSNQTETTPSASPSTKGESKHANGEFFKDEVLPYLETIQDTLQYSYKSSSQEVTVTGLSKMQKSTQSYSGSDLESLSLPNNPNHTPEMSVINSDTIDAASKLYNEGYNPLVLNMANATTPGGGVLGGARAQEEDICRKTALYYSIFPTYNSHLKDQLSDGKYRIEEHGCIYSPMVPILYEKSGNEFEQLSSAKGLIGVSFVSSAAYCLIGKQPPNDYEEGMRKKIRAQILTAIHHNHDSLLLGAFGCGAFRNDPKIVAQLYQEELKNYMGYFKKITFAILVVNKQKDQKNLDTFQAQFST